MKKIITLFALILLTAGSNLQAQLLANTTWAVYDETSTFYILFNFDADTLSYSNDNITYENVSLYQESANNLLINDLPGLACDPSVTGSYTFQIVNDSLQNVLISDACPNRPLAIADYFWVRLPLGIEDVIATASITIYPNPAENLVTIQSSKNLTNATYLVYNQIGKQVMSGKLVGKNTAVNIEQLASGVYFFQIGENGETHLKVVKN
jgi:hypothetical protein